MQHLGACVCYFYIYSQIKIIYYPKDILGILKSCFITCQGEMKICVHNIMTKHECFLRYLLGIQVFESTLIFICAGSVVGLVFSIAGMLIVGSMYEGGLRNFYTNTAKDYSLLCAMVLGFVISSIITIVVSLCTHTITTAEDTNKEWANTINIDNPLNPFKLVYKEELESIDAGPVITAETMDRVFRKAKLVAIIGACASLVLFLIVIPAVALSFEVLTYQEFSTWITFFQVWVLLGTVTVIVVPPFEEGRQIWRKYKENKRLEKMQKHGAVQSFPINTD